MDPLCHRLIMERGVVVEESAAEKGRHHRRRTSKNAARAPSVRTTGGKEGERKPQVIPQDVPSRDHQVLPLQGQGVGSASPHKLALTLKGRKLIYSGFTGWLSPTKQFRVLPGQERILSPLAIPRQHCPNFAAGNQHPSTRRSKPSILLPTLVMEQTATCLPIYCQLIIHPVSCETFFLSSRHP